MTEWAGEGVGHFLKEQAKASEDVSARTCYARKVYMQETRGSGRSKEVQVEQQTAKTSNRYK